MPQYIEPVIDKLLAVLLARTPALLAPRPPFAEYARTWTGVVANFPAIYVMPRRTDFDLNSQQLHHQAHQITLKLALSAGEPDELTKDAVAYARAVSDALNASYPDDWDAAAVLTTGQVLMLFVLAHDYGPLFEAQGRLARFPEIEVLVETEEAA